MNPLIVTYVDLLKDYNQHTNLYSESAYDKLPFHLEDCEILAGLIGDTPLRVLDIGSGSGLPSIPLAILRPSLSVTAVESKSRKTRFLQHTKEHLRLDNYTVITANINEYLFHQKPKFDVVTAKAFASYEDCLNILKNYAKKGTILFIPISEAQTKIVSLRPEAEILNPKDGFFYIRHIF